MATLGERAYIYIYIWGSEGFASSGVQQKAPGEGSGGRSPPEAGAYFTGNVRVLHILPIRCTF